MHTVTPDQSSPTSAGGGGGSAAAASPGAPHGPVPWSRRVAAAPAGLAAPAPGMPATQARVAANRWSAIPVGTPGARRASQSEPGATSGEARVQAVPRVSRLEIAAPSPTGCATQDRPEVSSTQPPRPSTTRNDDQ